MARVIKSPKEELSILLKLKISAAYVIKSQVLKVSNVRPSTITPLHYMEFVG